MQTTKIQSRRSFRSYEQYLKHYFPDTSNKDAEDERDDPHAYGVKIAQESLKKLNRLRSVK